MKEENNNSKGQEKKAQQVENLKRLIESKRGFIVADIKNLSSANFQEIRKKIRDKAEIKMYKKSIIF